MKGCGDVVSIKSSGSADTSAGAATTCLLVQVTMDLDVFDSRP